jgi:hypothetical protein
MPEADNREWTRMHAKAGDGGSVTDGKLLRGEAVRQMLQC